MNSPTPNPFEREARLNDVIAAYLEAVEACQAPDRPEWLARHPDLADDLRKFFANHDRLKQVGEPLRPAAPVEQPNAVQATLAPEEPVADQALGTVRYFGDYELREEIARGGMGVIYKARQVSLNRIVALKMILAGQLASADDVRRFRTEAEAAANLDHPNIVPIYEVGEHEGQHYFSMKLITGGSLTSRIPELVKDPKAAARLVARVARAVHHAHQRGILHRDLKPANILVDSKGEPHVTDFGLAKRTTDAAGLTRSNAIVGTPSYMAPEQARSEKVLTTAVDVYSLGAILYEMLTGRPPFHAATPLDTVLLVLEQEPVPPHKIAPRADRDLQTICLKCLDKNAAQRYGSAEALAEDLERWLHGEPIQVRPTPMVIRAWKWARRRPAAAALVGTALLAGVAILLVGLIYNYRLQGALSEVREQKRTLEHQEQQLRAERDQSQARLWKALFEQGRAERLAGDRWRSLKLLAEAARQSVTPELRQEAIESATAAGIHLVCHLERDNAGFGGEDPNIAFSADGQLVAAAQSKGIKVWRVPSGDVVGHVEGAYRGMCFSPTAPLLAIPNWPASPGKIRLWEPETKREVAEFPGQLPFCFNPTGHLLAFTGTWWRIGLWDVRAGKPSALGALGEPVGFLNAEELLVNHAGRLQVWNVQTGRQVFETPADWVWIGQGKGSPMAATGRLAALRRGGSRFGLDAGPVAVWDLAARRQLAEIPDVAAVSYARGLPMCPEANRMAFPDAKNAQTLQLYDVARGQPGRRLLASRSSYGGFNADGTVLALETLEAGSANLRLWDVASGASLAFLTDHVGAVWSPDGRYLAAFAPGSFTQANGSTVSGSRMALNVYEVAPGAAAGSAGAPVHAFAFSADGKKLAACDTVWRVNHRGRRRSLIPLESKAATGDQYVATAGRLWALRIQPRAGGPDILSQVFPEHQDLPLSWIEQRGPVDLVVNLAVSPSGKRLLLARQVVLKRDDGQQALRYQLELHDLTQRKRERLWVEGRSAGWSVLRFSPDGGRAAVIDSTQGACTIWDVDNGAIHHRVALRIQTGPDRWHQDGVQAAEFSPDGRLLYTAGLEGGFAVIDVESGSVRRTWSEPPATAQALAVSPDGGLLASAGEDGLIRLWDAATGKEWARWRPHVSPTTALAFSPDGEVLASGGKDGTVKLWDLRFIRSELATIGLDW
jgi:WD40 repeat protein/tRNA A-37 threonylcarbamoyl transferase component Bud32